jgi:hypothetical protein
MAIASANAGLIGGERYFLFIQDRDEPSRLQVSRNLAKVEKQMRGNLRKVRVVCSGGERHQWIIVLPVTLIVSDRLWRVCQRS